MTVKQSRINPELEEAIKAELKKVTGNTKMDVADRLRVINAAMKWEQIKHKIEPEEEEGSQLMG